MKQIAKISLLLVLALSLLVGCNNTLDKIVPPQSVTCEDITLTLPGYFIDFGDEDWAEGFPFVYGFNETAVLGVKDSVDTMDAAFPNLDAKGYAEMFIEFNELDSTIQEVDGVVTFSYTAESDGMNFTYLCGAYKGETNFWVVQCYCETKNLADYQTDFMDILKSVKV